MGWDGYLTHRQFMCWQEWLDYVSVNNPSRDNYYQMQIACEIRRSNSKNPRTIKPEHYKLKFGKKTSKGQSTSFSQDANEGKVAKKTPQQDRLDRIKQGWIARMTAPITVKQDGQVIDTIEPPAVKAKRIREEALKKARETAQAKKTQKKPDGQPIGSPDGKRRTNSTTNRGRNQVRPNARGSRKEDGESGGAHQ